MEVMEFIKQKVRMCDYYDYECTRKCSNEICPAHDVDCNISTNITECLVEIVEKWAKEHPEEMAAATTHKNVEPSTRFSKRKKTKKHKVYPILYGEKEDNYGTEVYRKGRQSRRVFWRNREQNRRRGNNA